MEKKIVFFLYDLSVGGAEQVVVRLSNYLIDKGHKIEILLINENNFFKDKLDRRVQVTSFKLNRIITSLVPLIKYLKTNNFDFFLSNVWPVTTLSVLAFLFSPKLLKKLILVEHCHLKEEWKQKSISFKAFQYLSIKFFHNFSKKVLSVSEGVKEDLVKKGVKKDKNLVVYNPAYLEPTELIEPNFSEETISWSKGNHLKLISVGNLKTSKNYPNLIRSMDILKNEKKLDCKLLILGDGPERKTIEEEIKKKNLEKDVILYGYSSEPLSLINLADIFVLSSDYEGFGLVIIEAMSLGKTIVSTNCKSGPGEIIKENEFGYLANVNDPHDLAEKIEFSMNNRINEEKLKKRAKEFSIDRIGAKYELLFN